MSDDAETQLRWAASVLGDLLPYQRHGHRRVQALDGRCLCRWCVAHRLVFEYEQSNPAAADRNRQSESEAAALGLDRTARK